MKKYIVVILSLLSFLNVSVFAAGDVPYTKTEIKSLMKKVADWQLAHQKEVKHHPMDWTNATLYIGMVKWAELADKVDKDETYYKWLVDMECPKHRPAAHQDHHHSSRHQLCFLQKNLAQSTDQTAHP